ncbi:hypothetical protein PR003_g6421 [Phytophthora rubi]|uniref:Uncharacterized protein n=1 Tax=Phytophthora rubi TaxID=129364 RepID=A0A6A3N3A2_9STRA|nr:hypothetical protein PR002_g5246 [Phytophthora rubi]KAE9348418.1 hypothetical protein PR003_g6421 [Phytophthora rubi]
MVGLSTSGLKLQILRAGETIEYFSYQFVSGDLRGQRAAKVLNVARGDGLPIQVDTLEAIPLTSGSLLPMDASCDEEIQSGGSCAHTRW